MVYDMLIEQAFLSTPSGWRATNLQSPPNQHRAISIHALRVEGDSACTATTRYHLRDFYPRPPGGGRLRAHTAIRSRPPISIHALRVEGDPCVLNSVAVDGISIHALRVEGDRPVCFRQAACRNFYPRPPGGGRRPEWYNLISQPPTYFYPRPPGGGRLANDQYVRGIMTDFYPRPPGGGRQ